MKFYQSHIITLILPLCCLITRIHAGPHSLPILAQPMGSGMNMGMPMEPINKPNAPMRSNQGMPNKPISQPNTTTSTSQITTQQPMLPTQPIQQINPIPTQMPQAMQILAQTEAQPQPSETPTVQEPPSIELSEQNRGTISSPAITNYFAKAEQTCKLMETVLKTLEQTIASISAAANEKLVSSSTTTQSINIDIGKLQEAFNPKETN